MSQQERIAPPSGTSYASGSICPKTAVYKATDGRMEFLELVKKGDPFPKFPGGTGTTNGTWSATSETSDGSRSGFQAVKVAAGTL
jgi:hypothetical protein